MKPISFGWKPGNEKGFTFIELLMVMIILGILTQMATTFVLDLRKRAFDAVALSDGKNLMSIAGNVILVLEDVDFTHTPADGSDIGVLDTSSSPRAAIFTMSQGVQAGITGQSDTTPGSSFIAANLFHPHGTDDPITPSGKREFYFFFDEATSTISVPAL
jgi:prepilin-type N-terminal cleavage/methylation domain-containing protein